MGLVMGDDEEEVKLKDKDTGAEAERGEAQVRTNLARSRCFLFGQMKFMNFHWSVFHIFAFFLLSRSLRLSGISASRARLSYH